MLAKLFNRFSKYQRKNDQRNFLTALIKNPNVHFGENICLGQTDINLETNTCSLYLGDRFYTRAFCSIRVGDNGRLTIHPNVFWNNGCSVNCMYEVEIGENVMFGESVKIYDHNHEITKGPTISISREKLNYGRVIIGKNTWLGANVIILKGVTIGENVVIGANCLIYKDIPANSIVKNAAQLTITTI